MIHVRSTLGGPFVDLLTPARYKAYFGGRGSGKSHSAAEVAVILAAQSEKRVVCGRQFMNSIRESVKHLIDEKIDALGLGRLFVSTDYEIRHRTNGSHFIFIGLDRNKESVKSLEGADIFLGEEAQTFSQRSLDLLLPTIRKPGSELWFLWNPGKESDPIDLMFRGPKGPPEGSIVHQVSWRNNPWFMRTALYRDMLDLKARDPLKYQHVYEGDYERLTDAQVFKNWRKGVLAVPDNAVPLLGCDWGFSNDPLALTKAYLLDDGRTLYVEAEAGGIGITIDRTPALFDVIPATATYRVIADSARPELIAHMHSKGYRVEAAMKGAGSVKEGVAWLQARDIVVNPSCVNVLRELQMYSWKVDRDRSGVETVLPDLEDANNHWLDALRYSVEGERKPKASFRSIRF